MQLKSVLFLILLSVFVLQSCTNTSEPTNNRATVTRADTVRNEYAKGFQLIYLQDGIQIDIKDPLTEELIHSYVMGREGEYNYFSKNIEQVVALSTTHTGMLRALFLENLVSGVSDFDLLCHPFNSTRVIEVGDIGNTHPEKIMAASPDLVLYSGYNLDAPILNKLEQVGIQTFLIYDWKEPHPLGRVEWLKVFGALFQKEREAADIFTTTKKNYQGLVQKLKTSEYRPTVLSGTYFSDVFNAPAGESYFAHLLNDANVEYAFADTKGTGSLSLSLEEVITKNKETEFWVNPAASTIPELLQQNDKFRMLDAVQNRTIYSYFKRVNCYWENASFQADKILEDLGKIFHPELFEDEELTFYDKLEKVDK